MLCRVKWLISGLLWLSLAFFGCTTVSVQTDYNRKIDFARYRIFRWIGARDRPKPPPEWLDKLVRAAAEQELLAKGYQKANGKEPDFLVAYDTALEERTVWQPVFSGTGMTVCPYTFQEGTLLIDFVDVRSNQVVWRGCGVDVASGRDDAQRRIPAAIKQILKGFPPKQ